MREGVKLGAVFPQSEIGAHPAPVRDFAQRVEELGFAHLIVYDHVLGAVHAGREPALTGPYTEETLFHEPFVLFGFLAEATRRIELTTGVLILPQRQTALVAKQAAEVDVLSEGRLRLGVGVGWNYVEYEALNETWTNRGKRQEEQIEVLRRLFSEPVVDYRGKYHRIDRAGLLPLPERRIPIWLGGFVPAAYRRAARVADGFIYGGRAQPAAKELEQTLAFVREAGRPVEDFGSELIIMARGLDGPEAWVEEVRTWQAAGGTHASFVTMDCGLADPQAHMDLVARFRDAVRDAGLAA